MHLIVWRAVGIGATVLLLFCAMIGPHGGAGAEQEKTAETKKPAEGTNAARAYRFNTLGVAHMSQQRPADAQKYFEQALQVDPKFAVARLNLGVEIGRASCRERV